MVKCLPEFEYFTVFLKNKIIIFKIRRSKVTDYAALRGAQWPSGRMFDLRPRGRRFESRRHPALWSLSKTHLS